MKVTAIFTKLPDYQPSEQLQHRIAQDMKPQQNIWSILWYSLALNLATQLLIFLCANQILSSENIKVTPNTKDLIIAQNGNLEELNVLNLQTGEHIDNLAIRTEARKVIVTLPPGYYLTTGRIDGREFVNQILISSY